MITPAVHIQKAMVLRHLQEQDMKFHNTLLFLRLIVV